MFFSTRSAAKAENLPGYKIWAKTTICGQVLWMDKVDGPQLDALRTRFRIWENLTPWALVKELVDTTASADQLPLMVKNVDIAERCELYAPDVHPGNYGGGKFSDLGVAKVMPYPRLYWPALCYETFFERTRNRL
ncbi:hypothetical protein Z517_09436 [Fonsecaea pedrosoi CBS 271.37]|uniref:Uncharacterized protein n=1 Tax=Fonsecaea pedrosoi CBS 271.37 TaxID=1442368 RepID=A0A0D2ERX7_9EURO|nr:uncharacterized protein Z517_09436 [Fonsecaea pedrosoi CBS 271.37]KIW76992.1 hypothetical protein Z517_09436 [Fonsecaea pedrosoi CBS 271.37]